MKDIRAIISENAADLDEDKAKAIADAVLENYRTRAEVEGKAQRIKELQAQVEALTEQVSGLEGEGAEVEALRKQVSDFEAAEKARTEAEAEKARRDAFSKSFDEAVGERKFVNGLVREKVLEKAFARCSGDDAVGVKDAIDEVTKDQFGIWVTKPNDPAMMPSGDISANTTGEDAAKRSLLSQLMR